MPRPGEACSVSVDATCGLPAEASLAAERAIFERFDTGHHLRLPFIGFEVRLTGGSWLPRYSNPEACAKAACMAYEEALRQASPMIVEPYTRVSLLVGFDSLGWTIQALSALIGELRTTYRVTDIVRLDAEVPVRLLEEVQSLGLRVFSLSHYRRKRNTSRFHFPDAACPALSTIGHEEPVDLICENHERCA